MADPLTGLLQQKKQTPPAAKAAKPPAPTKGLFDFDVESTLSRKVAQGADATVGERIFEALAARSTVDFPKITEICERVAQEPQEVPEAVRLLAGAFNEREPPRRKFKALTIMNELLYDPKACHELRQVFGVRDALWKLQATFGSGLGDGPDEQIRMLATEVEKKTFGSAGDPFSAPVAEDPFSLPVAAARPAEPRQPRDTSSASVLGALWQVGSVVKDNLKTGWTAAQEAAEQLTTSQGSGTRCEFQKLPMRPTADRPTLDIRFEDMLPGEKVHYAINPAVLLLNKPFRELQGRLLISRYRMRFQVPKGTLKDNLAWVAERQLLDVPLGLVEKLDFESTTSEAGVQQWRLNIITKDFRHLVIMVSEVKDLAVVEEALVALSQPGANFTQVLFAFPHAAAVGTREDGWSLLDPRREFERMGITESCPWLISPINSEYELCDTYPSTLVLPRSCSREQLRAVAGFRKRGRIPTMSWCSKDFASLWRCSQPMEGLLGQPDPSDEKMLHAIRNGKAQSLLVVDLRPRKAAYVNKVGGGGFESYDGCRLVFGNIDNVHGVRDAWKKMAQAMTGLNNDEVGSWFRDIANSGWYDLIGNIFQCANYVVHEIETLRCNAVIHCSDGWDRTAQVSSVAMLCMDPHYRSLRGLLLLIQKEFCNFGHRFRTRLANGEKPTSEYSPIFFQWLECVYQMTLQFPTAFEFTADLLLYLTREVCTNRWGTFLGDCEKERMEKVRPYTLSLWSSILSGPAPEFLNARYCPSEEVLRLSPCQAGFKLWEEYWFRFRLHPRDELAERCVKAF
ncbi:unnamed protein product [Effrenium voratum]|uniref:Myotubularin phosphatase domain-containing protein n=1 Tax=Effrenium voratum TaxID=2562239 RepID=A0AA36I3Y0_9DINO|nr:unnamed protein product [Effrenium voratum]CAJ1450439.1 unnamed protein product [Effrenium voratum]